MALANNSSGSSNFVSWSGAFTSVGFNNGSSGTVYSISGTPVEPEAKKQTPLEIMTEEDALDEECAAGEDEFDSDDDSDEVDLVIDEIVKGAH